MLLIGGATGEEAVASIQDSEVAAVVLQGVVPDSLFHRMVEMILCKVQQEVAEGEEEVVPFLVKDTTSKGHHKEEAGNT